MPTYNKFDQFVEDVHNGVHNLSTGVITAALTDRQPLASDEVLVTSTEIAYTNLPTSRVLTLVTSTQVSGTYTLTLTDSAALTATGGAVAQFQWVVIYNDTPTSPADPLIAWYDYGSKVNLADTETFTIDLPAGVLFTAT